MLGIWMAQKMLFLLSVEVGLDIGKVKLGRMLTMLVREL